MRYIIIVPILSALFICSIAYADGYAQKLDQPVGDYIANVDYDSSFPVVDPLTPTRFSFQLWNKDRTETVAFNDVYVEIIPQDGSDVIFAGGLNHPAYGDTGFRYIFQKGGAYKLYVRFEDKDLTTLAEATFPLSVNSVPADPKQFLIVIFACLFVGGAAYGLGRWYRKTLPA